MHCVRHLGNQPLYSHSARPVLWKGRGWVCWSMRRRLTRVGRSARLLYSVLSLAQYYQSTSIMQWSVSDASIFKETTGATAGFYIVSCQRYLYTVSNPYTLSIFSHGFIITLLVVCCISVASSAFSPISCSEITRFCTTPVQNYAFLKEDLCPSTSESFCEWAARVSPLISRIRADLHPDASLSTRFTCLDVSVTAHAVDLWWLAHYVLTRLEEGRDTLIKASSDTCRSSAINERILAIACALGSAQCRP